MSDQIRAVIFDFDGLLVDTETAEYLAWRRLYVEHGATLEVSVWQHAVGYDGRLNPRKMLEEQVGRQLDWSVLVPRKKQYHIEQIEQLPPLPGVVALMQRCKAADIRIGVASNSSSQWVREGLERVDLMQFVEAYATRDEVANPKPLPDVYLLALDKLGAAPESSVAFEDSEPGVRSAKAAGLYVVAVPNEFTCLQDLSSADQIERTLEKIDIEQIFSSRKPARSFRS